MKSFIGKRSAALIMTLIFGLLVSVMACKGSGSANDSGSVQSSGASSSANSAGLVPIMVSSACASSLETYLNGISAAEQISGAKLPASCLQSALVFPSQGGANKQNFCGANTNESMCKGSCCWNKEKNECQSC